MFLMSILGVIFIIINCIYITRGVTLIYTVIHCNGIIEGLMDYNKSSIKLTFYGRDLEPGETRFVAIYLLTSIAYWLYLGLCMFSYNWFLAIPPILLLFYPKKRQGAPFIVFSLLLNILCLLGMLINYTYFHHIKI